MASLYCVLDMRPIPVDSRVLWWLLAALCAGLAVGSLVLTSWFELQPCYLCIFQRLLYLLLAIAFLAAALLTPRPAARWAGFLALALALTGLGVALHQSWLQLQPPGSVSCMGGEPGLIEQWVEGLARLSPELFLATGFCEDAQMVILGLSLANWSALGFIACLALGWLAWRRPPERRIFSS